MYLLRIKYCIDLCITVVSCVVEIKVSIFAYVAENGNVALNISPSATPYLNIHITVISLYTNYYIDNIYIYVL